jgi:signal transduction histidine kinase
MIAYVVVAALGGDSLQWTAVDDQKALVLRLATMGTTVLAANLVVRIERDRRRRAVALEHDRQQELRALEERSRRQEEASQDARQRLLREVHDGVAQGVYMLGLGLEGISRDLAAGRDPEQTRVDALGRVAKQTLLETRGLLFDLHRVMTGESTLSALVRSQLREFETVTGIAGDMAVHGTEQPLSADVIGELYRVLQESLTNVYKHAKASRVTVSLCYEDEGLLIEITDNGRGLQASDEQAPTGHGLRTMVERTAELGGSFSVSSEAGAGTSLSLRIPRMRKT